MESNTTNTTARSVYERTGDAAAALELLKLNEGNSSSTPYNEFLCKSMVSQCQLSSKWLKELQAKQDETEALAIESNVSQSPSLLAISKWIMTYNRGLCLIMLQRPNETWDLVWPMFESDVIINKNNMINVSSNTTGKNKKTTKEMEEFLNVSCHMALLLLQALLEPNFNESLKTNFQRDVKLTLDWLQTAVTDQVPLLKFLYALVNSRMELSPNHKTTNAITDNKIRTARKDLKQAMEIFQHKLKTASTMQSNNQESSALNLKANTERLKGNVKKSLVLLGEAKNDETDNSNNLEQMHHYNNLALVYHSDGKPNLALHSWSKALSFATTDKQASAILQSNGTPQTNHQISVLYNASLTCLQHQKYQAAYECMAVVVKHWNHRADCWLRLAEACIGWHAQLKETQLAKFQTASNSQGELNGIVLQNQVYLEWNATSLAPIVGSPQDIEQLQANPLPRARACLTHCIELVTSKPTKTQRDGLVVLSARLSMSYICLEQREYDATLKYAGSVLQIASALLVANRKNSEDGPSKTVIESTIQRQVATSRLYGAEASCAMGDASSSMTILVGEDDEFIDRLASDLAGVTLEDAANYPDGKARLAKAQAMVRCNASIVSARLDELETAKQFAVSAQAMEGAYQSTTSKKEEPSYAKRALVYCVLRDGNSSEALKLLRSAS